MKEDQIEFTRKALAIISVMAMAESEDEYEDRYVSSETVRRNLFIYHKIEMRIEDIEQVLKVGFEKMPLLCEISERHNDGIFRTKYRLGFSDMKDKDNPNYATILPNNKELH